MQPSKLSEMFRGQVGLSAQSASRIARVLNLSEKETEYFVCLVESKHARSKLTRKTAQEKIQTRTASENFDELSLERFKIISDWYHYAILELTDLTYYESTPEWIAGRLGIPTEVARDAIQRLLDFGLLAEAPDGKLIQTEQFLATPSDIPSREIREHHSQILQKGQESLEKDSVTERDFSAITMAFDTRDLERAKEEIKLFRRKFSHDRQTSTQKDRIYCLSIQLIPLDQKETKETDT